MGIYLEDHPPKTRQFRCPRRAEPSGLIVVHTAESFPDETGPDTGAENTARFIANRTNPGSYHHLADSDSIIQLVRFTCEAFHDATGSNPHSYGVSAATQAAKWASLSDEWVDGTVRNMALAASTYARWVKNTRGIIIPAARVTRPESEARHPGFISHAERDPERRTDPGKLFPWDYFLDAFAGFMNPRPKPPPDPAPPKGLENMLIVTPYGSSNHRAISFESRTIVPLTELGHQRLKAAAVPGSGIVAVALPNDDVRAIALAFEQPHLVDDVDE